MWEQGRREGDSMVPSGRGGVEGGVADCAVGGEVWPWL